MSNNHPLMHPLRSENLKPRSSAQAVWNPTTPLQRSEPADSDMPQSEGHTRPQEHFVSSTSPQEEHFFVASAESAIADVDESFEEEDSEKVLLSSVSDFSQEEFFAEPIEQSEAEKKETFGIEPFLPMEDENISDFLDLSFTMPKDPASAFKKKNTTSSDKDAIPNEQMPVPVCVPLYEESTPAPKRRLWPWLLALFILMGCIFAVWRFC